MNGSRLCSKMPTPAAMASCLYGDLKLQSLLLLLALQGESEKPFLSDLFLIAQTSAYYLYPVMPEGEKIWGCQ